MSRMKTSLLFRCAVIAILSLWLQGSLNMLSDLTEERANSRNAAVGNIAGLWGGEQAITGPVLIIPYVTEITGSPAWQAAPASVRGKRTAPARKEARGRKYSDVKYLFVLPKTLHGETTLESEMRYRGIYEYPVYKAAPVTLQGTFTLPGDGPLTDAKSIVYWDKATINIGLAEQRSLTEVGPLVWDGAAHDMSSASGMSPQLFTLGLSARISLTKDKREHTFSISLRCNGSGGIYYAPLGEQSSFAVAGNWPSPNFDGYLLPEERSITPTGFSARWNVPHLTRPYPQWGGPGAYGLSDELSPVHESPNKQSALNAYFVGVRLQEPAHLYHQIYRAVRYGILFIGLTFAALLTFELLTRTRLHLVQYALVGAAMALFYLTLLALAEHIPFRQAFAAAGGITVGMNGLYIASVMRSVRRGALMAALLAGLYGVLYAVLQMEEYSIMVATGLLVGVLGALMFLTRRLNREPAPAEA